MPEQLLPSVSSDTLAEQYQLDEPEVINYSNWAVDNATEDDEIQNRVNYSNFVRQEYIKHGTYDSFKSAAMVEDDLRNGLRDSLIGDGLVAEDDQETIASLYAPTQKTLDEKLSLIKAHYGSDSEEWNVATRYQAHNTALEKSGDDWATCPTHRLPLQDNYMNLALVPTSHNTKSSGILRLISHCKNFLSQMRTSISA